LIEPVALLLTTAVFVSLLATKAAINNQSFAKQSSLAVVTLRFWPDRHSHNDGLPCPFPRVPAKGFVIRPQNADSKKGRHSGQFAAFAAEGLVEMYRAIIDGCAG